MLNADEMYESKTVHIQELAEDLELALVAEYMAKTDAFHERGAADGIGMRLIHKAYVNKVIDGRNADIRKAQEASVLGNSDQYMDHLRNAERLDFYAAIAEAERRAHEALIGLTKAWLYSQSGR